MTQFDLEYYLHLAIPWQILAVVAVASNVAIAVYFRSQYFDLRFPGWNVVHDDYIRLRQKQFVMYIIPILHELKS